MPYRFDIDRLLLQTQEALDTSRAKITQSKRDRASLQQVREEARRMIEESHRLMAKSVAGEANFPPHQDSE